MGGTGVNLKIPTLSGTLTLSVNNVATDSSGDIILGASDVGAEPALGNPSTNGYVLSSTTSGVRSWVAAGGGGGSAFPFTGSAQITGSLGITGSLSVTAGITGSLFGTSSWANNAVSASFATTASFLLGNAYTVTSVSTTYSETATSGTKIIKANTTGGAFTITLPTAVSNTATIVIKKTAGAPALTVDGAGSETIDDGATAVINTVYESITLVSDNANWLII
jgi:hypothetical protein